jgi:phospholipid/cholesterol/gamma-HCH transport system substrate-binding protein
VKRLIGSDRTLGAAMAVLTLLFLVGVVTGVFRAALSHGGSTVVRAQFSDTRQVRKGAPVRIDGVDVGKVDTLALAPDRRTGIVTMKIDGAKAGPLHADAHAHIRFRTLLGGAFYVDLDRGSSGVAALGSATIPVSRTDSQVELDDITTLVKGDVRRGLHTIPAQLAVALRQPAVPAAAIKALAHQSPSLAGGLQAARGSHPDSDVQTLVSATSNTVRALDAPGGQLKQVVSGAATLVQTTASRHADIERLLRTAPGVLKRTNATLDDLGQTLRIANPVLANVSRAAPAVAPTVAKLHRLVGPANTLLGDAVPLLRGLSPAVKSLATAARQGTPLLDALDPVLQKLDKTILPYSGKVDPDNGHTMAEMVGPGISGLAGIGSYLDNNGRYVRFPASAGNSSFYLPCQLFLNNPDASKLIACNSISTSLKTLFGWSARKKP